jgi:predicted RNA binding protein YcfA (HicA-like mRNA interferase family)
VGSSYGQQVGNQHNRGGRLVQVAQKGSHVQFKHPTKPGKATVPHPKKDLPPGTLKSIGRQTGVKLR